MSETETTYEIATRCPRCNLPGQVVSKNPSTVKRGAFVHMVFCRTPECPWENTSWVVQVNQDGSVPPAIDHKKNPDTKNYPSRAPIGRDEQEYVDRIQAQIERQVELEMKPGTEVANPNAPR